MKLETEPKNCPICQTPFFWRELTWTSTCSLRHANVYASLPCGHYALDDITMTQEEYIADLEDANSYRDECDCDECQHDRDTATKAASEHELELQREILAEQHHHGLDCTCPACIEAEAQRYAFEGETSQSWP